MLNEIENYCIRNRAQREKKLMEERKRQHESEHTKLKEAAGEGPELTVGGEAEPPVKDVDPSLVGSLENVYQKEPRGIVQEDPFQNTIIDDKEKPTSLLEMEKTLDAMVPYNEGADVEGEQVDQRGAQDSTAEPDQPNPETAFSGGRQDDSLPDLVEMGPPPYEVVGVPPDVQASATVTPDVASISGSQPPDLAVDTRQAVDLLGETGLPPPTGD